MGTLAPFRRFAPSAPCAANSRWSRAAPGVEALLCARTCPALLGEGEPCRNYLNLVLVVTRKQACFGGGAVWPLSY